MASCAHSRAFFGFLPATRSGSSMFSIAERTGIRLYDWKMKPIFSALKRVLLLSDILFMDSPSERSSRPESTFKSVVFPLPEGPIMATISPRLTPRSTPLSARTRRPPAAYTFWTPVASIMSSAAVSSTNPPPRSVETDPRHPSTTFSSAAYTLRNYDMRVAENAHRTSGRSWLGLQNELSKHFSMSALQLVSLFWLKPDACSRGSLGGCASCEPL